MKPLKDILNESLLNKSLLNESLLDDEDELFNRNDKTLIELWVKENCEIYGTLKIYEDNLGFVVDFGDNIEFTNKDIKSLTNGMFRWGKIAGDFDCSGCTKLRSLEGAPNECYCFNCEKCTGLRSLKCAPNECVWFKCSECTGLRSLEGAPRQVDGWFKCSGCTELRTLEGAPSKCDWFDCTECTGLTSLEGAPKKCDWFDCSGCKKLRSLKGAPSKCKRFDCAKCTGLRSLEGVPVGTTIKCSDCTNLIITDDDRKKYKIKS